MNSNNKHNSKFLSFILRHKPEEIGLQLDKQGWADIDELIEKAQVKGKVYSREIIESIVESNDKKRFAISEDGNKVRANQGHSIQIELGLAESLPPKILLHGTAKQNLDSIMQSGLQKRQRHHVHLTENGKTAKAVGQRYGKVVVLSIDTESMLADGFKFYLSENNVWLVDSVPAKYISFP